jgi:hypothetical protein
LGIGIIRHHFITEPGHFAVCNWTFETRIARPRRSPIAIFN